MRTIFGCAPVAFLLLLLPVAAPTQAQNLFFQPPSYPGSGRTATADFNHDGKPDLVSTDGTVMLGNGDGTFKTAAALALSVQGSQIATGDFNNDGSPDVIVASVLSTNLYIFVGNGDGTFKPGITSNIGTTLDSMVVADVNGDGKADLVGLLSGTAVFVLLEKGDGTFAPGATYPVLGNSTNLLTVGDFNGDGKLDIALIAEGTSTPGSVGVLFGNGDGTFRSAITSTGVGTPAGTVVADFNGDGKLDLAISDSTTTQTFILIGNGDGTFQAPGSALPATGLLATVDLNGDGKPDLLIGGRPFVEVFLGNGDGTLTAKGTYMGNTSNSPSSLVVADFNGDGKADAATGGIILLGNGDGTLQGDAAISLGSSGLGPAVTADFNRDGKPDIAVVSANNASNLYILLGDGTGKFSVIHTYALPLPAYSIVSDDLNGDGKLDLVFITQPVNQGLNINVMLGNGDGTFAPPTIAIQNLTGTSDPSSPLALVDFNGDHRPDLAVLSGGQLTVLLGKGDGTFASPMSFFPGSGPTSLVTADLNGDGKIDVAVSSSAGLGILLGNGDGSFQAATFPVSGITQVLAAADLNGDGKVDLIASTGNLQVLLGNGDGTFDALPVTSQATSTTASIVDVNGDGKLDLVMFPGVLLGNGDGTFAPSVAIVGTCSRIGCPAGNSFLIADFNGDNRPDLVIEPGSGIATILNVSPPPAPDFLISASAISPALIAPGGSVTSTVSLTAIGGFSGNVALSCTGLPNGANCNFTTASLNGAGASTLTITTNKSTPLGTYPVSALGTGTGLTRSATPTLTIATTAGATTAGVAPSSLVFGPQASGTSSSPQIIRLTNTGVAQLMVTNVSIGGQDPGDFAISSNGCQSSVTGGGSCTIGVTFTSTLGANRSASLSITDNATGSPRVVTLSGSGPDFSLNTGASSSVTVTAGQTASYTLALAPLGGFNQTVSLGCTGAPAHASCTVSPNQVMLNGTASTNVTVMVTTTAASHGFAPSAIVDFHGTSHQRPLLFLVLVSAVLAIAALPLLFRQGRGRWVPIASLFVFAAAGLFSASCGGGSSGGGAGSGIPGTQSGTYTITVFGSDGAGAATLTHNATMILIVK